MVGVGEVELVPGVLEVDGGVCLALCARVGKVDVVPVAELLPVG